MSAYADEEASVHEQGLFLLRSPSSSCKVSERMVNLRSIRKQKKYPLARLARDMEVERQTVYNWESGKHPMSKAAIFLAAHLLGVEPQDISS